MPRIKETIIGIEVCHKCKKVKTPCTICEIELVCECDKQTHYNLHRKRRSRELMALRKSKAETCGRNQSFAF